MDFFKLLGRGTKFNNKYADDLTCFKPQPTPSLDYFDEKEQKGSTKNIKTYGTDVPPPISSFQELRDKYGVQGTFNHPTPTPIQMQSIPIILEGRQLMGIAPTGSGKTMAFLIPILHLLEAPCKKGARALIITPTRELALQIERECEPIQGKLKVKVLGKNNIGKIDVIITTPMRLLTALKQEQLSCHFIKYLVLDEADKLLEQGFLEQVDDILAACPDAQKYLFSATIPSSVEELASTIMIDPIRVVIGHRNAATETIEQKLEYVGEEAGKLVAIRQLIVQGLKPPVLIFVQSVERAKELFHELVYDGVNVDVIHSERTKAARDNIITQFRLGNIWVLIATEVLARGIDFKGVNLVINYDFPQTCASYIHRIGRTGRAGRKGKAITFFTKEDAPFLKTIVNVMKASGCPVPDWMLSLKNPTKQMKQKLRGKPIERDTIKTISKYDLKRIKRKQAMFQKNKPE